MTSTANASGTAGHHATTHAQSAESGFALLGVFGPDAALRALVQLPGGRVQEVERGARLDRGTIVAIDRDGLILLQGGETRRVPVLGG